MGDSELPMQKSITAEGPQPQQEISEGHLSHDKNQIDAFKLSHDQMKEVSSPLKLKIDDQIVKTENQEALERIITPVEKDDEDYS